MHSGSDVFIFGTKIFREESRDVVSSLPLELTWTIFAYLDDFSLRKATLVCYKWKWIILTNKKLRIRLNHFELADTLGSRHLAKFHRRNKRKLTKKHNGKNYLQFSQYEGSTSSN